MTTWGDFRAKIRRTSLKDELSVNFTDEVLLDSLEWALTTFCAHTAVPKTTFFDETVEKSPDVFYDMNVDTAFVLPEDVYESPEISGVVWIDVNGSRSFLDPLRRTPGEDIYDNNAVGFTVYPDNSLNLRQVAGTSSKLTISYFGIYTLPVDDDSVLQIPRWSHAAIQYLVAAYALTGHSIESSTIDRWKDKNDSGNPEHNSLRVQQKHMMAMYEREISRIPYQDRTNFFRNEPTW